MLTRKEKREDLGRSLSMIVVYTAVDSSREVMMGQTLIKLKASTPSKLCLFIIRLPLSGLGGCLIEIFRLEKDIISSYFPGIPMLPVRGLQLDID